MGLGLRCVFPFRGFALVEEWGISLLVVLVVVEGEK